MDIAGIKNIFDNREARILNEYRFFSVLVPLVSVDNKANILFEVRSGNLKMQPNEICFPGGKVEENESPRDCAIRETSEELNIPLEKVDIITELDHIITYSNFTLYCYLGQLEYCDISLRQFNRCEVEDIFLVPFDFFIDSEPLYYEVEILPKINDDFPFHLIPDGKNYNWRKGMNQIYIYQYEDRVIWGLTAKIINNMVKIIKNHK